jgi:uncharacterized protein YndB with AHSA1/START domain
MAPTNKMATPPDTLVVTRTFAAPRRVVFAAWSSADHLKRWFSPETFTVPEAQVDFRPGGVFSVCMRAPDGRDHWSRGHFTEISAPDKLSFASSVGDGETTAFEVRTTVTFEDEGTGVRMTVRQTYDILDEAFAGAVDGASEGWRTTLDKLDLEVARISAEANQRSVVHSTFSIERTYRASPIRVFHALIDPAAKAVWFSGGSGYTVVERTMDVRAGGRERLKGRWDSGMVTTFDAIYLDVVHNERLVYAYEMTLDDRKISVSLATVDLSRTENGTRLVVTEQGAFLDGYDDAGSREKGTGFLLDRLGVELDG